MVSIRNVVVCVLLQMIWTGAAMAQGFLPGTEDIPVMPGLEPSAEAETVFDTPAGRIVTVSATAPAPASRVSAFYAESLPALGWRPAGPGRFVREGEALQLSVRAAGTRRVVVQFTLSPVRPSRRE